MPDTRVRSWVEHADCRGAEEFASTKPPGRSKAARRHDPFVSLRRICAACDVREECLQDALAHGDFWHFRAGLTPDELQELGEAARQAGESPPAGTALVA